MSTLAVVEQILRETAAPMSVRQIVVHAAGRLPTKSKTPDTVVARDLSMDLKKKGDESLFCRVAPGRYALRELHREDRVERDTPNDDRSTDSERGATVVRAAAKSDQTMPLTAAAMRADRAGPLAARASSESESSARPTVTHNR